MDTIQIRELFDGIIEKCRERANDVAEFDDGDGAIRICCLPQGILGDRLIRRKSQYADRLEFVARIRDGGNYVLHRAGDGALVDTYALSAMKVATCLRAYEENETHRSGTLSDPECNEMHGFSQKNGALLYELTIDGRIFALIVVCVSGADEKADEYVAEASTWAIEKWCTIRLLGGNRQQRLGYIAPSIPA